MNRCVVLFFLFSSCETNANLILDTPAHVEMMAASVLAGEQLKISPDDYPEIQLLLNEESTRLHRVGLLLAGQTKNSFFYPFLFSAAVSEKSEIADTAIQMIREDSQKFREYLIVMLTTAEPSLRNKAILILSRIGDEDIVPLLIQYFADPSDEVRNQASQAVYSISDRNNPFLQAAISSSDPLTASIAYRTLGRYGNAQDAPLFIKAFTAPDPRVQKEAQLAMLRLGEVGLPYLHLRALDKQQPLNYRIAVLNVIQGLRSPGSLEMLFDLLESEDEQIRAKTNGILGTYGPEAIPFFTELYEISNNINRIKAVQLMGAMGISAVLPLLAHALADESPEVGIMASEAMKTFGTEAWPILREVIDTGPAESLLPALEILRTRGDSWLVWREPEKINKKGVFSLITELENSAIVEYLDSINTDIILKENILSLKEAWGIATEFNQMKAELSQQSDEYYSIWRKWERYSTAATERLRSSFEVLHKYFDKNDPKLLKESKKLRKEGQLLESKAKDQETLLEAFPQPLQTEREEILERYTDIRNRLVQIWEYLLPEMRASALAVYSSRKLNPVVLTRESRTQE